MSLHEDIADILNQLAAVRKEEGGRFAPPIAAAARTRGRAVEAEDSADGRHVGNIERAARAAR